MTKTVAVIQARTGSTRLPGKVLMELRGKAVLGWCVRACRAAYGVDEVRVATSTLVGDDAIEEWCIRNFVPCTRGSETDVLSRFMKAAEESSADIILRLTGDCPFLDPAVISSVVRLQQQTGAAYCSNVSPRTYPDGLDVECFTRAALEAAHVEATRTIDRDTVTNWIRANQSRFPAEAVINPIPGMETERWVLDTEADLGFCKAVAHHWDEAGAPSMFDILAILDANPDLRKLNANRVINERFYDALAEEPLYPRSYGRSQSLLERAEACIPLGTQTFSKSKLQYPQPSALFVSHGDGALVWDVDGNEYVDLVSALLPNILGYRDPDVDGAVRRQLARGISFSLATELEAELAEMLVRLIPCAEMVRFGKTGTDVTTAAVRLARACTGRGQILICGGYHGWADWSVERNLGVPGEVLAKTMRVPFGDTNAATAAFSGQTVKFSLDTPYSKMLEAERALKKSWIAAIIVEPETNPEYLAHLRSLADTYGAVLIFDEVITGFRFSLGGAQKYYGVTPDLACFGKAMANGMPLSALVGKREIMKKMAPPDNIFYSGTFFGETLSLAASIATIKKMERENTIDQLWKTGLALATQAQALITKYELGSFVWFEGKAPFVRIKFYDEHVAALFRREMVGSGTLVIASHNICAAHGPNEIRRILKSYDHTLGVIRKAIDGEGPEASLGGASVGPMVRSI